MVIEDKEAYYTIQLLRSWSSEDK